MVRPNSSEKSSPERTNTESTSQLNYKGVRKRKWGKWVSEIRLPNSRERIWLGSYDTPEKAARAFDAALYCLRGSHAKFNFPDNPPEISNGRSLTPPEIQLAAARFANGDFGESSRSRSESENPMPEYPSQSPSPSVSDGVVTAQCEPAMDWAFLDLLTANSAGTGVSDYGVFSEMNEFSNEFLAPEPEMDYGEEMMMDGGDGVFSQHSFLWNF